MASHQIDRYADAYYSMIWCGPKGYPRIVPSNAPASPHALLPAAGQPRTDASQATIGPGSAGQPGPTALDDACVAPHHLRPDPRAQHAPPCTC